MKASLFERYPEACETMRARGYGALVEMAKHIKSQGQMAKLLGLAPAGSGVSKWFLLDNNPSKKNLLKIQKWVNDNKLPALSASPVKFKHKPVPIRMTELPDLEAPKEAPDSKDDVAVLMVVCSRVKQDKITRILEMLKCEVVEI